MTAVSALVGGVAGTTVLVTLLAAGLAHLVRPDRLWHALAAHDLLPAPTAVAATVIGAEVGLGGIGVAALAVGSAGAERFALVGAALTFAAFAGYSATVRRSGRGGPCGCAGLETTVTGWVVTRAAGLAALATLALTAPSWPAELAGGETTVVLLAAATIGVLGWHLPAAMREPVPPIRGGQVRR